jgi:16S rRNA U516 pseudouridylate synthase RsuA-like enzyme
MGDLTLGNLKEGAIRELTHAEIGLLAARNQRPKVKNQNNR